jgi:hypothetical protein
MNPKQFLTLGGAVLLLVGILGMVGVIGPTHEHSIFGSFWWFDTPENIAHTVLGVAALGAAFVLPAMYQRYLVIAVGALALVVGLYNLMGEVQLLGANLESPADLVLHLGVGAWAMFAAFYGGKTKAK